MTSARVGANGRFRTRLLLRSPGPYHVRYGAARSAERTVRLLPRIEASLVAAVPVGARLSLRPRLVPVAVLWYPLYFKGGFAIHGYPSVPAYAASHGCVRIPMWIAPSLFGTHGYGTSVVVHA